MVYLPPYLKNVKNPEVCQLSLQNPKHKAFNFADKLVKLLILKCK